MMAKLKLILFGIFKRFYNLFIKTGIHRKIKIMVPVYDFLFQHLWSHQDVIEIQGSKMYINVREKDSDMRKTFQGYAIAQTHEELTTSLFKKVVKEGDVVVDLGANIGYFTLLAARLVGKGGKVYAFEPEPRNYNYLLKNIELNAYDNVFPAQKAVSDKIGKTKLYLCPYDTGHHTINQQRGIEDYHYGRPGKVSAIDIETVTLDEFMKNREGEINVIKMDIEGAEALALFGMDKTIRGNKNLKMFVEFFPLLIRKMGNSPEEFIRKLLEDYRFLVFVIPGDYDAPKEKFIKIKNVDEVMHLCRDKEDHLNLFIKKASVYSS